MFLEETNRGKYQDPWHRDNEDDKRDAAERFPTGAETNWSCADGSDLGFSEAMLAGEGLSLAVFA